MSNIIKLGANVLPGEPDTDLIETLERLLEDAKSGNIRALAYATVCESEVLGSGWTGVAGTRYHLGSSVLMLQSRYASSLLHCELCDG